MPESPHLPWIALSAWTAVAAVWDARSGRIPNGWIVVGLLASALAAIGPGLTAGASPRSLAEGLATAAGGGVACAAVPGLLWRLGWMGGGDVKLFCVIGACAGPHGGLNVALLTFLTANLWLPVRLIGTGKLWATVHSLSWAAVRPGRRRSNANVQEALNVKLRMAPMAFVAVVVSGLAIGLS